MEDKKIFSVDSFFAGVGGIDIAFEQINGFKTIYANEYNPFAAKTYEANFNVIVDQRDINEVPTKEVPDADVFLGGFPCQAFSIAGYREGFDDKKGRGNLFFELVRMMKEKRPRACLFENVKNLVGHDNGRTFRTICESLDELGYTYTYQVLNAMDFGNMPQNRERIYIVAFRDVEDYARFKWPRSVPLTKTIKDVIDFETKVDEKYYYTPGKYKGTIYEQLVEAMDDPDAVYQWRRKYVRKNKSGVIPTLTANQGEGGHNVCLIKTKHGIRKMTPRECFNAQGFPSDYLLPDDLSDTKLYKQAGNSVCVPVVKRIAENLYDALK